MPVPTTKTVALRFSGPIDYIDRALLAFAAAHGWTPTVLDDQGAEQPNHETAADAAGLALANYVKAVATRQWEQQQFTLLKSSIADAAATITVSVEG